MVHFTDCVVVAEIVTVAVLWYRLWHSIRARSMKGKLNGTPKDSKPPSTNFRE